MPKDTMKRAAGFIASWVLFWCGDFVSRFMDYWPSERLHPYFLYSRFMSASDSVQQWSDCNGPWRDAT